MATIFQDADFVGKEFSTRVAAPAYMSPLAVRYYFVAQPGLDVGRIRAVIVDTKTGKKFFNVVSPNYPGKQLYFKFESGSLSDLVAQGVRTTTQKAKDDKEFEEKQNETFWDKLKVPLMVTTATAVGGYVLSSVGKEYVKTRASGRK